MPTDIERLPAQAGMTAEDLKPLRIGGQELRHNVAPIIQMIEELRFSGMQRQERSQALPASTTCRSTHAR